MATRFEGVDYLKNNNNKDVEIEHLPRVVETSPQEGDMLAYQSGEWVNVPKSKAGVSKARLFFNSAIS